jgi:MFS transporter, MHS family, citrate/tricarballylate:H+ symporter
LILQLRRSLKETEEFKSRKRHPTASEALRIIGENWTVVLEGVMLSSLTTTTFYLITAYTPTFGSQVLHFAPRDSLIVTLYASAAPTCSGFLSAARSPTASGVVRC